MESWDQFRLKISDEVNEELAGHHPLRIASVAPQLAAQKVVNYLGLSDFTTVLIDVTWSDSKRSGILITRVVLLWPDGVAELA